MFLTVNRDSRVNLSLAQEIRRVGDCWYADFGDGDPIELGRRGGEAIDRATATIVPSHPGETLHRLNGWGDGRFEHEQHRIIAWELGRRLLPEPITSTEPIGTDGETMTLIERPDGCLEEQYAQDYPSLHAAKEELFRRIALAKQYRGAGEGAAA